MIISTEFRKWLDELDELARKWDPKNCTQSHSKQTGEDCWYEFFKDDYSAEDALREDWSNV